MTISIEGKWLWDNWYYRDGDTWHAYFLQADTSLGDPELRHWNVSQGHATSLDLVHWQHHGVCLKPSAGPAWDDLTTWTGSVVREENGLWHLFYTGTSSADEGKKQRIGHAISSDGHDWQRVGNGLCLDLNGHSDYEEFTPSQWHDRAMRDPWVMRDPDNDRWLMYFTARSPGIAEANAGGAIGFATSTDLQHWTLESPTFVGSFGQLEVPQVFQVGQRWYCLFCNIAEHWSEEYLASYAQAPVSGTHYLMADSPHGPWRVAPGVYLDGDQNCSRYAGRILHTDHGLALMAFVNTPNGRDFIGQVTDPLAVVVDTEGLLRIDNEASEASCG